MLILPFSRKGYVIRKNILKFCSGIGLHQNAAGFVPLLYDPV